MSPYHFHWKVSGMGECDWEVYGDGPTYRIQYLYDTGAYFQSIFNGTAEEFQRERVAAMWLVHKDFSWEILPKPVFDAWIQHCRDKARADKEKMKQRWAERGYEWRVAEEIYWEKVYDKIDLFRRGHYDLPTKTWIVDIDERPLPVFELRDHTGKVLHTGPSNDCYDRIFHLIRDYDAQLHLRNGDFTITPKQEAVKAA